MEDLRHHSIRFTRVPASGTPADWEAGLRKVTGVKDVRVDEEKGEVFVEYDIRHCCEEAVEHWMVSAGFTLDESFVERVKRGWVHYTEENERDAFGGKPHVCCDLEEIERKKKALRQP